MRRLIRSSVAGGIGTVLLRPDRRIASTGYNGVPPGDDGCLSAPCERVGKALRGSSICAGYSDCRSVHTEANALLYASKDDCTDEPCSSCMKLIRGAGVARLESTYNHHPPPRALRLQTSRGFTASARAVKKVARIVKQADCFLCYFQFVYIGIIPNRERERLVTTCA
ncbi:hypothetical protein [Streptosporangium sp. NBC_01469]|uniref:hypothetical protein n=1 Tax=unclassified Streptosporangium TaxID=2632669 RepID=UPI003FCD4717